MLQDTFKLEIHMKVEELAGSTAWIKSDQFRSVPGKIEGISKGVNLDDIKSSVSQSAFRVEMPSGHVIEILGPDISKMIIPAKSRKAVPHKPPALAPVYDCRLLELLA